MPTHDPLAEARARIAEEAERRTGALDLSGLGLPSLPDELFALVHLKDLRLGAAAPWNVGTRNRIDAQTARFAALEHLQYLDLGWTDLRSLLPIRDLFGLQNIFCSGTQVSDLGPLACLPALQSLDCSVTQVSDLGPLASFPTLHSLDCSATKVSDLGPLAGLSALQSLDCSATQVSDLSPLASLPLLQSLGCSDTQVSDLGPLAGLSALQSLDCSAPQISNLGPLAGLSALQRLVCSGPQVSDLGPLAGLSSLQSLDCYRTQVSDLGPLAGLSALQSLDCSFTQVSDLGPLAGLSALQRLDCYSTQVSDLGPLAGLSVLQSLDCSLTRVCDLGSLAGLSTLLSLYCSDTPVSDLGPLASLSALQLLTCSDTRISDLGPLTDLSSLQTLRCSGTKVTDLGPLVGLASLEILDCSDTQVIDLSPLASCPMLNTLYVSGCRLIDLPPAIWAKASLQECIAFETQVPDLPHGILSASEDENCLPALRAHFADLAAGTATLDDVRLLLLGNGAAGKTQVARWLAGMPFEARWDSTHGIRIVEAPEPGSVAERLRLRVWDFGGQDIYHGAHALFLRGPAVLAPVWAVKRENAEQYEHESLTFRNHPLAYWLDVARHAADPDCPVLVLQTQCDAPADERPAPIDDARRKALHPRELRVSPKADRRRAALEEELRECIAELRARFGRPLIGAGRLRVRRRLENLREADAALPPEARRHRLIERSDFEAICAEEGGVSSPGELLRYLDADGTVLHRPGLFDDRIVLDLGWALEAVYAVFDRKRAYATLQRHGGRFTLGDLGALVWREHGEDERRLLLSLMLSCGMCFRYSPRDVGESEAEYVAPDLLPGREAVAHRLENGWDADLPGEGATFRYALLHGGLIRSILSEIGALAGPDAVYWRGGFYGYDRETRSRLLIEEEMTGQWEGVVRVRTQKGQARALLEKTVGLVGRVGERLGMKPTVDAPVPPPAAEANPEPLVFVQERSEMPEFYVSYAWRDDLSPEGRKREEDVDRLCDEARAKGRPIIRDKTSLTFGDDIRAFMRRIGAGYRIFVFLSDKYLRSPACMFELSEVWRNSRQEDQGFNDRVRLFTLSDVKIWSPRDRALWAVHWKKEHDELAELEREHGPEVLGESGLRDLRLMRTFYQTTADMLDALANRVQPRTFDDFVRHGFDDPTV